MSSTSVLMSSTVTEIVNQLKAIPNLISKPNILSVVRMALSIILPLEVYTTEQKGQILDQVVVTLFENQLTPTELAFVKEMLPAWQMELLNLSTGVVKIIEEEASACCSWLCSKRSSSLK